MGAEDDGFLADPFHVLKHLPPPSANSPACPTIFLAEKVNHIKKPRSPLLFIPGDTSACYKTVFAFYLQDSWEENTDSWNSDEGWPYGTQEEAGFKYLARRNLILQLHTPENLFKMIQVPQSCGLKFTMAKSVAAGRSYSGITLLTPVGWLRSKANSRQSHFLEMGHSWVGMCLLILVLMLYN